MNYERKKENIKEQINFSTVFQSLFPENWKNSGKNHLCPFHDDNDPSLTILEDNCGYCHACDKRFDIIDLVMNKEECEFTEAIEYLDDNYSIGIADINHEHTLQKANKEHVGSINLNGIEHILQERGLLKEISELIKSNTIELDGTIIVVPVSSNSGQVVGYQKIDLLAEKQNRYTFKQKSKVKDGIFAFNPDGTIIVVVESFLDGLSVAKMAPNFNVVVIFKADGEKVNRLLKDTTEQIILFFDNDHAGQKATQETADLMYRTIKTVDWSIASNKVKDANELLVNNPDLIINVIKNAKVVSPFEDIVTAQSLIFSKLPEPSFIVKGLLPQGLTLLAGKPKRGKSFFALNLGSACANGAKALGTIYVEKQGVLYLALEDQHIRLRNRLLKSDPDAIKLDKFYIAIDWPRIGQGCEDKLESWLKHHPEIKLVIIDTLEKVAPVKSVTKGIYSDDYSKIQPLKAIADKYNIAIMCIHHLNKRDSDSDEVDRVSGSTGLTGAVDTIMILNRDINRADAKLYVCSRDFEEREFGINFDNTTCNWSIIGEAEDLKLPKKQNEIYRILKKASKAMSPNEIKWEFVKLGTDKNKNTLQAELKQLLKKGIIYQPCRGYYCVSDLKL